MHTHSELESHLNFQLIQHVFSSISEFKVQIQLYILYHFFSSHFVNHLTNQLKASNTFSLSFEEILITNSSRKSFVYI